MHAPIRWPGNARCAVMLSFDVDAETIWINGNRSYPHSENWLAAASIGQYGPRRAVPRILDFLAREEIRATFFVPGWVAEHYPETVLRIAREGHEVGHHGYFHERFFDRTVEEQRQILERSRDIFRSLLGQEGVGFRTPSGDFSVDTPRLLDSLGFHYTSSMRGSDRPYRTIIDGRPSDLIEIPPRWELDDFVMFGYNLFPADPRGQDRISGYEGGFDNYRREFDGYHRFGLCYVLMMHPQVIGKPGRLRLLADLVHHMKACGDVWFATGDEIAGWWRTAYPREEV